MPPPTGPVLRTPVLRTPVLRTVRMTFRPDAVPAFLDLFAATRERIAAAPGCRHLALWQDPGAAHVLTTVSLWDDAAALDAYRASPLFRATWAETKRGFAAPPVALSHVAVSGGISPAGPVPT